MRMVLLHECHMMTFMVDEWRVVSVISSTLIRCVDMTNYFTSLFSPSFSAFLSK